MLRALAESTQTGRLCIRRLLAYARMCVYLCVCVCVCQTARTCRFFTSMFLACMRLAVSDKATVRVHSRPSGTVATMTEIQYTRACGHRKEHNAGHRSVVHRGLVHGALGERAEGGYRA